MDSEWERVVQEAVSEVVAICPWMEEAEVALVQQVFGTQVGLAAGEVVDVGRMAGALLALAARAEAAQDRRRAWTFDQWYRWACAVMRGDEYQWPELPPELAAVP